MNPIPKKVKGLKRGSVEYESFRLTTTFLSDAEEEEGKEEEKNQTLDLNETLLIKECFIISLARRKKEINNFFPTFLSRKNHSSTRTESEKRILLSNYYFKRKSLILIKKTRFLESKLQMGTTI